MLHELDRTPLLHGQLKKEQESYVRCSQLVPKNVLKRGFRLQLGLGLSRVATREKPNVLLSQVYP